MRFLLSILTTFALVSLSPALATPIYNPDHNGVHRMKPAHIRHIDEHGHVTYIHDQSDHRPDFCSIPGEEELCRLQIEAANRAPPVFDNGQTVQTIEPSELNPEHGQNVHREQTKDVATNSHANDITITLDNGEQVTLHNDPHPKNIYDPSNDPDAPPADTPHVPNINHGLRHTEHIKDDEYQPPSRPHIRNIKPGDDELPTINHPDNINHGANGLRQRERMADSADDDVIPERPHIRNINDQPDVDGPVTINHPDNTRNQHGQSVNMHTSSDKQPAPHGQSMHITADDKQPAPHGQSMHTTADDKQSAPHGQSMHTTADDKQPAPHGQSMHIMDVDPDTPPQDDDVVIDTNPHVGSFGPHPEYPKQRRPINKLKQNIQNLM